jgi:hypothetical protein
MPKLEYFVVCDSISIDQQTNRVSLFNIVEDLQPVGPGIQSDIIAQLVAVSSWNKVPEDEGKDFQVIHRIHTSDGEPKDFPMNFRMENPRQRVVLRIQGMPPMHPGSLRIELLLNGQHIADHIVTVHPTIISTATRPDVAAP